MGRATSVTPATMLAENTPPDSKAAMVVGVAVVAAGTKQHFN
jgi:hypothetical protein